MTQHDFGTTACARLVRIWWCRGRALQPSKSASRVLGLCLYASDAAAAVAGGSSTRGGLAWQSLTIAPRLQPASHVQQQDSRAGRRRTVRRVCCAMSMRGPSSYCLKMYVTTTVLPSHVHAHRRRNESLGLHPIQPPHQKQASCRARVEQRGWNSRPACTAVAAATAGSAPIAKERTPRWLPARRA